MAFNNLTEENVSKLKTILGQELKYKLLCEKIGIPIKSGASKRAQLKDLQSYCKLEVLEKPTRFIVKEVYENIYNIVNGINTNNKYQKIFDAALFHALLRNNGEPLYISNLELIALFQEVNENFFITFDINSLEKIGEEYKYMNCMTDVVYRVLKQWTDHKLKSMDKRGVIRLSQGFRVYKKYKSEKCEYLIKYDVPQTTKGNVVELDALCMTIYTEVYERCFPYLKEEYIQKKIDKKEKVSYFIPEYKLALFNRELDKEIFKATEGEYCKMKRVKIITPPKEEWLYKKLKEIYKQYPDLHAITDEVYNKVLTIKQLDDFTGYERKLYAKLNIDRNPDFLFKSKLEEIELLKNTKEKVYV